MTASNSADRRTVLAWLAFAIAVAICAHQRHFTLSLEHPDSFRVMLTHRCGDVFAAASLSAICETMMAFYRRMTRLHGVVA